MGALIAIGAGIAVLTVLEQEWELVSQQEKQWMQSQDSQRLKARSART